MISRANIGSYTPDDLTAAIAVFEAKFGEDD